MFFHDTNVVQDESLCFKRARIWCHLGARYYYIHTSAAPAGLTGLRGWSHRAGLSGRAGGRDSNVQTLS